MGKNPFHEDLDICSGGVRVRVHTNEHTYEGWCGRWHYNKNAITIYDAERDDGEQAGAVALSARETVERLEQEIEDLTEFLPGSSFGTRTESD